MQGLRCKLMQRIRWNSLNMSLVILGGSSQGLGNGGSLVFPILGSPLSFKKIAARGFGKFCGSIACTHLTSLPRKGLWKESVDAAPSFRGRMASALLKDSPAQIISFQSVLSLQNISSRGIRESSTTSSTKKQERKENIYTIPNALTLSRIAASPIISAFIVQQDYSIALSLLVFSALTDALDGWLARRYQWSTVLGSALDPAADKILMTCLVAALSSVGLLYAPLGMLIVGRDVALIFGAAWYRWISLPSPKTAKRYFDLELPSAEVRPPLISKVNTLCQLVLMGSCLAAPVFGFVDHPLLMALQVLVGITTIWSGMTYILHQSTIIRVIKSSS